MSSLVRSFALIYVAQKPVQYEILHLLCFIIVCYIHYLAFNQFSFVGAVRALPGGVYSLVPNRRGVGISGGLEKSPKHNKRVGWNSRGGGLEMMQ